VPVAQFAYPLGQGPRILGAAFKQRAGDLLPVTGTQRFKHDPHAQDRRNLSKRPERRVDMAR
jgi:hypothetical protein